MNAFLGELGRKLAERWVTLLLLPGALYVGVVTAASVLAARKTAPTSRPTTTAGASRSRVRQSACRR